MIKTKHRIIVDELGETLNALEFNVCVDDSPSLQEKWILVSELKKEIKFIVDSNIKLLGCDSNFDCGYKNAIDRILESLDKIDLS